MLAAGGGLCVGAVEEGDDLGTVADGVGTEGGLGQAVGNAVLSRPDDGLLIEAARNHIVEGVAALGGGSAHGTPQEGDDLGTVALEHGAEVVLFHAVGDLVLHSPQDCLVVEVLLVHIIEGIDGGLRLGRTGGAPQEGDGLGTEAGLIGSRLCANWLKKLSLRPSSKNCTTAR